MRILLVHNYLRPPSGENTVFEQETELLRSKGHEVITYARHNDEIGDMKSSSKALIPFHAAWSSEAYSAISQLVRQQRPDIAHFHNVFPLISPAAYLACAKEGLPVVQTLHNYRIVCPGALLFRNNRVCKECSGMGFLPGIKHGCYRDSRIQTAGMAAIIYFHLLIGTWRKYVDLYIALSDFALSKYRELGFPSDSFSVKTNFLQNPVKPSYADMGYGLYIGRIGEEKGIAVLLSALRNCPEIPFKVIGNGPIQDFLQRKIGEYGLRNVEYLGALDHNQCMDCLKKARFLVLPSQCYEGVPMVLLEAMSAGKPAIVSDVGVLPLMIRDGYNGFVFSAGSVEGFAEKMKLINGNPGEAVIMGKNARATFEEKYTSEINYEIVMKIYQKAIEINKNKRMR